MSGLELHIFKNFNIQKEHINSSFILFSRSKGGEGNENKNRKIKKKRKITKVLDSDFSYELLKIALPPSSIPDTFIHTLIQLMHHY